MLVISVTHCLYDSSCPSNFFSHPYLKMPEALPKILFIKYTMLHHRDSVLKVLYYCIPLLEMMLRITTVLAVHLSLRGLAPSFLHGSWRICWLISCSLCTSFSSPWNFSGNPKGRCHEKTLPVGFLITGTNLGDL